MISVKVAVMVMILKAQSVLSAGNGTAKLIQLPPFRVLLDSLPLYMHCGTTLAWKSQYRNMGQC